jgi:DNA-binding response OmpR family regulator
MDAPPSVGVWVSVMRRREHRVVVAHRAELRSGERRIEGATQDLCCGGVFVRADGTLPVGTLVELALDAGRGPVRIAAEVVHVLDAAEASSLGRCPGMGLSFAPAASAAPDVLARQLAEFLRAAPPLPQVALAARERPMRVVVVDESPRLLERAATALRHAGFDVETCSRAVDAFAACLALPPDVVLVDMHLAGGGALHLARRLGSSPELASVPVAVMSDDAGDLARLHAYRAGVRDFIPKPFTIVELCIRVRNLARGPHADRVVLRGSLGGVSLGSLLSLFETERKTGVLTITREDTACWITLAAGRVVKARSTDPSAGSIAVLDRALAWPDGNFELSACEVDAHDDEVRMSTMHLLLEHARRSDERARA